MTHASMARRIGSLIVAVAGLALFAWPVIAQQTTTPPAAPPKQEEVPFWAVGRPRAGAGAQMAPVPAFPIPTPADKLPIAKMKVPPGFKVEVWASDILDARGLRQGDKGWRIINIVADGVSDLALKRAEYQRVLAHGTLDSLIKELETQTERLRQR